MTLQAKPFLLTVLSGPHAGASAGFGRGVTRIGGGAEDDIILVGLPECAMAIRGNQEQLRVQARIDGIQHHDGARGFGPALPQAGKAFETRLPATFRLNDDTRILVARLGPAKTAMGRPVTTFATGALALVAGLWLGAQFGSDSPAGNLLKTQTADASEVSRNTGQPAPELQGLVATSPRQQCSGDCIEAAAGVFGKQLADAGLVGLQIEAEPDVLRVTGTMTAEQGAVWRRLRAGFESDFGMSLPLIAEIAEGAPEPVLAISSVWLGHTPEIRTKSGSTLHIGDTTPDGWTILEITSGEIRLGRGSRNMTMRY